MTRRRPSCVDGRIAAKKPRYTEQQIAQASRQARVRSRRRDGSFPVRTTSRAFARRIFPGMVSLQAPAGWSCQMPGGPDACSRHLGSPMEGPHSLHVFGAAVRGMARTKSERKKGTAAPAERRVLAMGLLTSATDSPMRRASMRSSPGPHDGRRARTHGSASRGSASLSSPSYERGARTSGLA